MSEVRVARWYFGGLAGAGAVCITHPLDLLKVRMQTHKGKVSMVDIARDVVKHEGILGLYSGISAAVLRQLTYSTARFGIYESLKQRLSPKDGRPLPFYMSIFIAAVGGFSGGLAGNPADLVNVRMQNDMKLPPERRRNYKNAVHGLHQVIVKEGVTKLWVGGSLNSVRSMLITVGQIAFYDELKLLLLRTPYFKDNVTTHIVCSLGAGAVATVMTQPVDVLKTRAMYAKSGEIKGVLPLIRITANEGFGAFFKGCVPAFLRLAPHTVLTFVFLEQLRMNFGIIKS